MKIAVFKIPEELRRSQDIFCFSIKPQAIESPAPSLLPSNVLEIYKKHIKEKREDERRSEFPVGARFIEPTIRLRKTLSKEQIPSPGMEKKNIRQEKEPEFKSIKLKDILKERENCALIADSGMGKTTILKELQYQIVSGTIPTEQTPIYFHFRDLLGVYSTEALHKRIMDLFPEEIARDNLEKTISTLFQQKRLLFLLDGLDQVEDMSNLPRLLERNGLLSPYRVIVAGRPYIYSSLQSHLSHYQYLTLDTFSVTLAKEYLGEDAYEHLRNFIQDSSLRAPMLLSILKELGQEIGHEINRNRIYEKMIDKLLSRETGLQTIQSNFAINNEAFKATFSKLSYTLLDKGYAGRFPWTIIDSLLPELKITLGDFVGLTHMGLISEIVEGHPLPDRDLVFRHQSFQEYLASLELKKRLFSQNKLNKEALLNHLEYNTWDDVLFFLIGSLENRLARETILLIYQYDPIMAGKCIAPYKGNKDEDFREVINRLFSLLKDADVHRAAAEALGNIGSERVVDQLISLLSNKDAGVRRVAAEALGKISSERVADHLISLLSDKDAGVRRAAALALGNIGSERAVDQLISLFSDENITVCWAAEGALGKIGSERVFDRLVPLLADKDISVRKTAAHALAYIGSEKAIGYLLPLLTDKDICMAAAAAFGYVRSEKAVDCLLPLLANKDIRRAAARALGEIGSEKAIDHLLPLLTDKDINVRRAAALALGNIGSEKAVDCLLPLLTDKDEDEFVREAVALALGKIGSERTVDQLISLLRDENTDVRRAAAEALGKIGSERAVDQLILLLSNENFDVRCAAAGALGYIGSEKAVDHLLPLLTSKDKSVLWAAAWALGKIGSEKAVDHLLPLLTNKDESVRQAAAWALGKISMELKETKLFKLLSRLHENGFNDALGEIKTVQKRRFLKILYPESFLIIK